METPNTLEQQLKDLTLSQGFIYALCSIIYEDFALKIEELNKVDYSERINHEEINLLLSYLQEMPNLDEPIDAENFDKLKSDIRSLLKKRHHNKSNNVFSIKDSININLGELYEEAIFYGDTGAYDFQYIHLFKKKYKYDKDWLLKEKQLGVEEVGHILLQIKYTRLNKLNNYYQNKDFTENNYKNLLDLFTFSTDSVKTNDIQTLDSLLDSFSVREKSDIDLIYAKPIIKISKNDYLVLSDFLLFKAVYESPYYWMITDKSYNKTFENNLGKIGEGITFNFLESIFGSENIFQSVKVKQGKNDLTDIDILCICGNKALCMQVKSKKLTKQSRTGDEQSLKNDFTKAVQNAYTQGIVSRNSILNIQNFKFFDKSNNPLNIPNYIDDVYILGVVAENYPTLTLQTPNLLTKANINDPFPLFVTIFDLEIISHYLNTPYEFLYYVRQRINLFQYFKANSELDYLSFHLQKGLSKLPNSDWCEISTFAKDIDQDLCSKFIGIENNNCFKQNKEFYYLCEKIYSLDTVKSIDIIFELLSLDKEGQNSFIQNLIKAKKESKEIYFTNLLHNNFPLGLTFISIKSSSYEDLEQHLRSRCQTQKYRHKTQNWIGFGCLTDSPNLIEFIIFYDDKWKYNENIEQALKELKNPRILGTLSGKIGRNDKCPCGSGLKYKKCCLQAQNY